MPANAGGLAVGTAESKSTHEAASDGSFTNLRWCNLGAGNQRGKDAVLARRIGIKILHDNSMAQPIAWQQMNFE